MASVYRRCALVALTVLLCSPWAAVEASGVNPVQKVVTLLGDLEAKIKNEGAAEEGAYKEFVKWCADASANAGFDIKTATAKKGELEAAIAKLASDAQVAAAKIADLAQDINGVESDLTNATSIRAEESSDFLATEAELMDAINTLERAIVVLEREMSKNPALLQQTAGGASNNVKGLLQTLSAVIDVASFSGNDKKKLLALVQNRQGDEDSEADDVLGAPAAAVYKSHSTNIVDVLEDMKEKAEIELSDIRKSEGAASHNYNMLKQSLTDQTAALNKDLGGTKAGKAESEEGLAQAKGDLNLTVKDLATAESTKEMVDNECATAAQDHETSTASRAAELEALAKAQEIIASKTGGAEAKVYSFMQVQSASFTSSTARVRVDLAGREIVAVVQRLADKQHSTELSQLASRISAVVRYGASSGEDPFAKVKSLISAMIERLERDASAEASHKAYCDEEMSKTDAKKAELTSDIDSLTAKIDKAEAASTELKTEVAELEQELAKLLKSQAEMDQVRLDQHSAFVEAKADLELGLEGVQEATHVLREYYGSGAAFFQTVQDPEVPTYHSKAGGTGSSIISMLEVIASDLSRNLAEGTVTEEEEHSQYEKMTQENKISKTIKEQDVKYKTQEAKALDKAVAEHSSDLEGLQTEIAAVLEYNEKLVAQCVAKPETYEVRKERREAEVAGLKEALTYLEGEAALVQQSSAGQNKHHLRSVSLH